MATCNKCGEYISPKFDKVFSDNEKNVFACPNCSRNSGISDQSKNHEENKTKKTGNFLEYHQKNNK